ncbi:vacuolar amino acid permease [Dacryopinax primogenitus]|uniref:Vacuolar amino acid permease n=1 Tax=Dacryopinax primogenitus (strain DJM 731) TaxID=1858805 RepID=M5FNK3_DACPD|nr:vacuolar amino acid permease [Dacryopinax primogenitus]EJT97595.1 vacuolar amino acid permease [Dacryopinax primogenitus]
MTVGSLPPSPTEQDPLLPPPSEEPKPLNHPSRADLVWILTGLWSAVFLGALDGTIVATLLTPIGSYFNKAHEASYLGTSYLLSVCCFTPLYGRLADILGRKGAELLALTLFGIGTVLCGIAPSMRFLIIARAVAGMGGGGIMTVSSIVVTDLIPLKHRGLYQGCANILFGAGAGLGGPLGGFLNDRLGWRWAFLIQIPFLVLSYVIVLFKVTIHLPSQAQSLSEKIKRIDYLGSLTLVLAVGCSLLGISLNTSEELPWTHPAVWGLLLAGGTSTVAFVVVEKWVAPQPVMPLRLLVRRNPFFVALTNLLVSISAFSGLYNVPLYFSAVRLTSATESGLHLLPNSVALSIGSLFSGWIMRHTGRYWSLNLFGAFLPILSSTLFSLWTRNTSDFHLWFDIIPSGFGHSSLITSTLIALIASVDRADLAVATGISYLFRTTGQVLGVSLSSAVVQGLLNKYLHERITGPGSKELIERIRHSTALIPTLDPPTQAAAVDSYAQALRVVFILQTVISFLTFLCTLPIQENPLP